MVRKQTALIALIGLAALAPVLAYAVMKSASGYVAAVSVVIIVGSFFLMLSPASTSETSH